MPTYRIEISPNNRAGCQDTLHKKEGVKIMKGEPRFGSWLEIGDHGSWRWKHWGCVSGKQLQNLREDICKGDNSYDFDMIDGYDEINDHPEVQAKIRTAMIEGKIADEDFNGDPEYNVLGQMGIRPRATKKKAEAEDEDGEEPNGGGTPVQKPAKKRGRKNAGEDDEAEQEQVEAPPTKKARKPKAKKPVSDDEDAPLVEAPKAKVELESDEEAAVEAEAPKKKGRAKKVMLEPEVDGPAVEQPKKKGRAKKAKVESETEPEPEPDEEAAEGSAPEPEPEPEPVSKKGGRKKKAAAVDDDNRAQAPKALPAKRGRSRKR
ncbi:protein kinase rad3 [Diaporthe helianthi]|uniref:Protein kinase rad3 n=1 Tax=Diaporthe helianthi TaxID=158607 RepID=A0A2P5IE84_DIAHE|nr:protein kinase rad3 [Diaporthe helianthi]